jgi:holin-like protein
VAWSGWPVSGSVLGMLALLELLCLRGGVPASLDTVAAPLLRHLMLLLIPSVAAVSVYAALLWRHAAAFAVVAVVATALTLVVTAWTLQRLLARHTP